MKLKNKIKMYAMCSISCAVMVLAGSGLVLSTIAPTMGWNQVYDNIEQTNEFVEYYNDSVEQYAKELEKGNITQKQFDNYKRMLTAKEYVKQLPPAERVQFDNQVRPHYNNYLKLFFSGASLIIAGAIGFFFSKLKQKDLESTEELNEARKRFEGLFAVPEEKENIEEMECL